MKSPKGWLLELVIVALADLFIGYLTVESLDSFTGAKYSLPLTAFLVTSLRLTPVLAGAVLMAVLASFTAAYVYWLWRYTPKFLAGYQGTRGRTKGGTAEKAAGAPKPQGQGMKVGDLRLPENTETQPFVDVVQLEGYPLNIYAAVTKEEGREGFTYAVIEPSLSEAEKARLADLRKLLIDELDVDLRSIASPGKAELYISRKVKELARKYGYKIPPPTMTKLLYYLTRDFIHLGKIEPLMRDKLIEDISCDGAGIPIYIWYRDYESIPTNIKFDTDEELDTFVSKLAYSAGKHVSLAEPIVDASLADGSRVHLTYGKEITQRGSTFSIRKFRVDPLTIVDLIRSNTLSSDIAAYLWYLIEKKLALLIAGGTASGKSVPYDEEVLVYREGRPVIKQIGALFDELEAAGKIMWQDGYEIVRCKGIQTAAFDSTLKVDKSEVRSIIRHASDKNVFSIKTRSGRRVRATSDHSVFTIANGKVSPIRTSDLAPGMYVAVPKIVPGSEKETSVIDLIEILSRNHAGLYVENVAGYVGQSIAQVGLASVARILKVRPRSIREGLSKGFLAVRVDAFAKLEAATGLPRVHQDLAIRPKTHRTTKLPALLPLTKALARFMGYWTAEGMYEQGVTLFQLDDKTRKDMIGSGLAAFGVRGLPNPGDRTRIDFNSSGLKAVFKKIFGPGSGAGAKRIPELIFGESNAILAEFLRGYFTGDAYVGRVIEASTKSRTLAHHLLYALSRFDIVARISPKTVKGVTYYRVSIFGQANLRKFEQTIGFLDDDRRERLAAATALEVKGHTNVDTIPGIAPLLKEALAFGQGAQKKQVWSDWHSYWSPTKAKSMSKETLLSYMEASGAKGEVEERLRALAYSDIFWDEVVAVDRVDYTGSFVYDLEVPDRENFVGGYGGIFLHNTTSLNALSVFIGPGEKIVSVEDTPELNLPHENWIQSVTRGVGTAGEITMFDLLKASLRQRPDVLIVGEVRGEEAYTLLQSIATGHGGLGTIHADSVEAVINRLTTEPMNIPRSLIGTTLDCIVMQLKIRLADRSVRRVVAVTEVVGHDPRTDEIILNDAFKWNPVIDTFAFTGRSKLFDKITQKFGTRPEEIRREIEGRKTFLDWLAAKNIRSHAEVSEQVKEFYAGPYAVINKAKVELEGLKA